MTSSGFRPGRLMTAGLAAVLTLAACSSASSGTATPAALPSAVSTFGTANGDVDSITWGLPYGEPTTIDPPNTANYSSSLVAMNLCEPLVRMEADYSISPNLATASQPDPLTLVYDLKPGITFWDGAPLTAADVVWSLEHAAAPTSVVSSTLAGIASITATTPQRVTVKLSAPDALLPVELATFAGAIQQKAFSEKAGTGLGNAAEGVMCTGPYRVRSWESGQSITLAANPTYWDSTRKPKVQTVRLRFITDSTSLAQALATGELDGAYEVPAAMIPTLQKTTSGNLVFGTPSQLYLALSAARSAGPLADRDVRRALYMSLDVKTITQVGYAGSATPNYTALNKDVWDNGAVSPRARQLWRDAYAGFEAERGSYGSAQAVTEAQQLARSAGYAGQPIVLAVLAGDATLSRTAQLIQAQAGAAGFDIEINALQPMEFEQAAVDPAKRDGIDLILGGGFNAAPAPLELMSFLALPGSFYNYTGYDNAEVTSAITKARATTDPVEQARLLIAAQTILEQDYSTVALAQLGEIAFVNKRLGGAVTSFAYLNMPSFASLGSAG
ncbi:peptide/nickel transport system substrate-binding protein [Actinoplanes lutulentus]|uniref:Peptide/nickel transport system substrate-binding protein n=1 Tax=Actinoplanes lutulentus TaxID=1287878 RepID=A0A327ZAI7_9ACTN|nr:ABC transporter substrate-binding protein [Actinoplanes lutulentus]MBB2946292.1 peptide/nickel transport system substrate-binding protein [Actinoplanes lutulentus]RAK28769.1 peptide/nickel transport system substrate-binding protein [Actinoplanes lutulentus]